MKDLDLRALCLHEAAHAVTAEVLRPGCVVGVVAPLRPGRPDPFVGFYWGETLGLCVWESWEWLDPELHVAIYAGREGEKIAGRRPVYDKGDLDSLRFWVSNPRRRARASRKAERIVRRHELAVRRVAAALGKASVLSGDAVRALMDAS